MDLVAKSIQQGESNRIRVEFDLSGRLQSRCQSGDLLVTKLALITLYYKFKQFTNILNTYFTFKISPYSSFRVSCI